MTTPPVFPSYDLSGTKIHFFDGHTHKLYIYRLEQPGDLNIVHIDINESRKMCPDSSLLDGIKEFAVRAGVLFPDEEVAMIC